jgi:hypothetical protein
MFPPQSAPSRNAVNDAVDPLADNGTVASISTLRLPRQLSSFETLGFSLSGLFLWLGTAPSMHVALGSYAMLVWLVGAIAGIMLNLQVRRLGQHFPDVSGGTPNYITRLLDQFPFIAKYGVIGYWIGWVSVPPMNAIIFTDLIQTHLESFHLSVPAH